MKGHYHLSVADPEDPENLEADISFNGTNLGSLIRKAKLIGAKTVTEFGLVCQYGCGQLHELNTSMLRGHFENCRWNGILIEL